MRTYLAIHRIVNVNVNTSTLAAYNGQVCSTCSAGANTVQWVPSTYTQSAVLGSFLRTDVLSFDTETNARDWAALSTSKDGMKGALVCGFEPDSASSAYMVIVHSWQNPPKASPNSNCIKCPPNLGVNGHWVMGSGAGSTPLVVANPTESYVLQFATESAANTWLAGSAGTTFTDETLVAGFSIP